MRESVEGKEIFPTGVASSRVYFPKVDVVGRDFYEFHTFSPSLADRLIRAESCTVLYRERTR